MKKHVYDEANALFSKQARLRLFAVEDIVRDIYSLGEKFTLYADNETGSK